MVENTSSEFMAQMMNLQQQYMQGLGQLFTTGQVEEKPANPFDTWWQQFPKSGQSEFDEFFRNLSKIGMDAMQNPMSNMQQPFQPSNAGADWFNNMSKLFEGWLKAGSPSQSVFDQMNEQFRQQLLAPFAMHFMPQMNNPFAGNPFTAYNPLNDISSPVLKLMQNLFPNQEKQYGDQLIKTLEEYQKQIMEVNYMVAQVGIDSITELQKNIAEQEHISYQVMYENWMDISKQLFDKHQLSEPYKKAMANLNKVADKLQRDFEEYQQTLSDQLGLVSREAYDDLRAQVDDMKQQLASLIGSKAGKGASAGDSDDFTVINGIGAKFNEKLHQQGVKNLQQLASMSDDMLKKLDEDLQSKGKLFEQQWREQAESFLNAMSGKK